MDTAALYQATLDSLAAHVAVLDTDGLIIAVNEAWKQFARDNGDPALRYTGVGVNYLEVCSRCESDDDVDEANSAKAGIHKVVRNESVSFALEYPCHSPETERWFLMYVTPLKSSEINGVVVTHVDITDRKKLEKHVRAAEIRYRDLFERVPVGLYRTTPDGKILDVNQALVQILGYHDREWVLKQEAGDFYIDAAERQEWVERINRAGQIQNFETRLRRRDGSIVWVQDSAYAVSDELGRVTCYEGSWRDVTERKHYEERLAYLAHRDPLTDLLNRRSFEEGAESHLSYLEDQSLQGALLWMDIDNFKVINDYFGHKSGDQVLKDVSRSIGAHTGEHGICGRWGGDEFAIFLPNTDAIHVQKVGERIRAEIEKILGPLDGTASVGIALCPQHGKTLEELMICADKALYNAKALSRNRVVVYNS